MEGRFNNPFVSEHEDAEDSPENSGDSPTTGLVNDTKATSTSSPKRSSRRGAQKRVVSVPIKEVESSRIKGETNAPPSDSWAWRKYGQKPIKGSPYPRGYYRCSSSKGCPARKQVERSRTDPTMVVVTYSSEHNHPWPASRNNHHNQHSTTTSAATTTMSPPNETVSNSEHDDKSSDYIMQPKPEPEENFPSLEHADDRFAWFSDWENSSSTMLESPLTSSEMVGADTDMAMIFSIRDEEDSFFADLGELPECSAVFRRRKEEHLRMTPWCGTTTG